MAWECRSERDEDGRGKQRLERERVQWVRLPVTKPEDLSSIPETHPVKEEKRR